MHHQTLLIDEWLNAIGETANTLTAQQLLLSWEQFKLQHASAAWSKYDHIDQYHPTAEQARQALDALDMFAKAANVDCYGPRLVLTALIEKSRS